MSGAISTIEARELARHPERMQPAIREAEEIARLAALMHRWEELDQAVKILIERKQMVVEWWDNNVQSMHIRTSAQAPGTLPMLEAEEILGINHRRISSYRRALVDVDSHAAALIEKLRRGADPPERDQPSQRSTPRRDGPDYWPTPHSLIEAMVMNVLPMLPPNTMVWEPAAGDGRLASAIAETGRGVAVSDLVPVDPDEPPRDYLKVTPPAPCFVITNPPFNLADAFIARGAELMSQGLIRGFVLLLRLDHLGAGSRVDALNAASWEVHCNWRPRWIDGTNGSPRWSFVWVAWGLGRRQPPLYLRAEGGTEDDRDPIRAEERPNGQASGARADGEAHGLFDMADDGDRGDAADDWDAAIAAGGPH